MVLKNSFYPLKKKSRLSKGFKMIVLKIILAAIVLFIIGIAVIYILKFDELSLSEFEPFTDEELMLLSLVEEKYYRQLIIYIRTLSMDPALQEALKDNKQALEAISLYLLLDIARKDIEKKERALKERSESKPEEHLSYFEKQILKRVKKQD